MSASQSAFHDLLTRREPVVLETLADLHTPLSAYLKVADAPYSFLLESAQNGSQKGRYSIIGLPARERIRVEGRMLFHETDSRILASLETSDPLTWIQQFNDARPLPRIPGLPCLTGGLVGYFGYDTCRHIQTGQEMPSDSSKPDPIGTPDILLLVADELVVFDNLSNRIYAITYYLQGDEADQQRAQTRARQILDKLNDPIPGQSHQDDQPKGADEPGFTSSLDQAQYEAAVRRIQDYIHQGEVMQVVPSQRLSASYSMAPMALYRALRSLNPSPYMFHFNFDDFQVVGASPEILVRVMDGQCEVRPIAGTRRRGQNEAEDQALARELLADPKEVAEHEMLIDTSCNDLARVCQPDDIRVTDKMTIERYSHVMHIVSNVAGPLRADQTPMDALRATFPAGTLSGEPKNRAIAIIDELEPVKRGVYGGAVGYLAGNGNMDLAIAIRTAVIRDEQIHVQAGSGIVADSQPTTEWEETMNKAHALLKAAAMARQGLHSRHWLDMTSAETS